jgi:hypothetical protein
MKFSKYDEKTFLVKKIKPHRVRDLNPKTLRMKTYKRNDYLKTDIPIEKRTFNNLPRYADKKPRVRFQDWLGIKTDHKAGCSVGKAESDGKWWGWSHRAVAGFGIGDKVTKDTCGNTKGEYTIKTDDEARQTAINFAKDIA